MNKEEQYNKMKEEMGKIETFLELLSISGQKNIYYFYNIYGSFNGLKILLDELITGKTFQEAENEEKQNRINDNLKKLDKEK